MRKLTMNALADEYSVSRRTVQSWLAQGCPKKNIGTATKPLYRFDTRAVARWLERRAR